MYNIIRGVLMRIDMHSHILPGIDDGSKNLEMSQKMLSILKSHGVDISVATPHFYSHQQSVDSFIQNRNNAYEYLCKNSDMSLYPKVLTAGEIYFYKGLVNEKRLNELCIEGTDYMLVELPYQDISKQLIDDFRDFVESKRVKPIIAHIERYYTSGFATRSALEQIMDMDVLVQINALSFYNLRNRQYVFHLIKRNKVHCLGTDAHNITSRPPFYSQAEALINTRLDKEKLQLIYNCAEKIINNCSVEEIKSDMPQLKFIELIKWFDKL